MTATAPAAPAETAWTDVCALEAIVRDTGVAALVAGEQAAVFRLADDAVHAIANFDPFARAHVLSRGIVGDVDGTPVVASPVYKQRFCLRTGACLDDEAGSVPTFAVRVVDGRVQVAASRC